MQVNAGITEHAADNDQFLIINLQHIALPERFTQDLFGVEVLTKVDIEYFQLSFHVGHGVEEAVDSGTAHLVALCQRTETDSTCTQSQPFQVVCERNIIPCHSLFDVITRHSAVIESHLHRSGRVVHPFELVLQLFLPEYFQNLVTQFVISYRTDNAAVETKLRHMISKISRGPPDFLSFGQHIP